MVESIDAIYDEMHESYKVGSIFMEHYNFTDPKKDLTKKGDRNLTRRLSGFEILNKTTLIFQKWLVSSIFTNICHYLNFPEEY